MKSQPCPLFSWVANLAKKFMSSRRIRTISQQKLRVRSGRLLRRHHNMASNGQHSGHHRQIFTCRNYSLLSWLWLQMSSPVWSHFREHSDERKCGVRESRAEARLPPLKSSFQAKEGKEQKDSKTSSLFRLVTNDFAPGGRVAWGPEANSTNCLATPLQRSYFHAAVTATPFSGLGPKHSPSLLL